MKLKKKIERETKDIANIRSKLSKIKSEKGVGSVEIAELNKIKEDVSVSSGSIDDEEWEPHRILAKLKKKRWREFQPKKKIMDFDISQVQRMIFEAKKERTERD